MNIRNLVFPVSLALAFQGSSLRADETLTIGLKNLSKGTFTLTPGSSCKLQGEAGGPLRFADVDAVSLKKGKQTYIKVTAQELNKQVIVIAVASRKHTLTRNGSGWMEDSKQYPDNYRLNFNTGDGTELKILDPAEQKQ